jgi:recombination protein U
MINYPNGKKASVKISKKTSASGRGMRLEEDINQTNTYYLNLGKAVIHKKPTPIQVVNVDYQKRSAARISEAYYRTPSTTDYNGVYKGKAIDFEAKETQSKTSFPLSSIHEHQFKHLEAVLAQGAMAFVLIRFTYYEETYYLEASQLLALAKNSKRSIPYSWFQEQAVLIPYSLTPPVDYLKAVDAQLLKEKQK